MDEENKMAVYEPARRALQRRSPPAAPAETEESTDLLAYWRVLRKRRWTVVTLFLVVLAIVLVGTLKQKPVYTAQALIEIEKENPNILSVQELFKLEAVSDTHLETQYKVLRSDTLARRVIQQLRLFERDEFNPAAARPAVAASGFTGSAAPSAEAVATALSSFRRRLAVTPIKRSRLVEVSFASHDPTLAADAVNAMAANYIDQSLEVRWEATRKATEWLGQQLQGLKVKLERSEEELQGYARDNGLLFLEGTAGQMENVIHQRLRQLQQELTRAQADRYEKESLYRLVASGDPAVLPGTGENRLLQDLAGRLADLRRERAELATQFHAEYPKVQQLDSQIRELEVELAAERSRTAQRLSNEYRAAVEREQLLARAFAEQQRQANTIAERSVQYNILKREVATNRELYEGLLGRMKEAAVSSGIQASNIRVVDPAEPPRRPSKPNVPLNLALGLVFGLGLGVGAAFLQEHLDNSLKSAEDIERYLRVPALAFIPSADSMDHRRQRVYGLGSLASAGRRLTGGNGKPLPAAPDTSDGTWLRIDRPALDHSALAEAFSSLRTSVLLSAADRPPRTLLVTSAQPGEGKTTISTNLAISLAQLGQRVLLVDGDMRRPSVHRAFGLSGLQGLSSVLSGASDWRALARPSGLPGLDVLVCGPVPPNPAALLSGERMRRLLEEAAGEYHTVLVDSPPMLNVSDSRILATLTEAVVLIVKSGTTPRELAQRARAYAEAVGARVIGVVLNNLDLRLGEYYAGYYYRYYDYRSRNENEGDVVVAS